MWILNEGGTLINADSLRSISVDAVSSIIGTFPATNRGTEVILLAANIEDEHDAAARMEKVATAIKNKEALLDLRRPQEKARR